MKKQTYNWQQIIFDENIKKIIEISDVPVCYVDSDVFERFVY